MAGQQMRTSALPHANVVANSFILQYYNILHRCPQIMYQFYQDGSRLTRAEAGPEGVVDSVKSQLEIHEKLKCLNYRDFKIQIISVDCQDSLNGGVIVTVTGLLYEKLIAKRRFVQSFFLAQQVAGYFVLNDMFRYLDEDNSWTSGEECVVVNELPAPLQEKSELLSPTEQQEQAVSASSTPDVKPEGEEIFKSSEKLKGLQAEDESHFTDAGNRCFEITPVIVEPPSPRAVPLGPSASIQETSEEAPKKVDSAVSYASVLRMNKNTKSTVPTSTQNTSPTIIPLPADDPPSNSSFPTSATTAGRNLLKKKVLPLRLDGRSVHVGNLPHGTSTSQLQGALGKFGLIRPDRVIIIKGHGQGGWYAFIEFEDRNSAQSAIRSSPVSFGGREVYIHEKKSIMGQRFGARGPQPRMGHRYSSFRREDFGREGTSAGRAHGQGQDKDTRFKGPGRGFPPTVSPNLGRGLIPNAASRYPVGAYDSGIDSNSRDTEATNGNRFSKPEGRRANPPRLGGARMAQENDVASGPSQHIAPV